MDHQSFLLTYGNDEVELLSDQYPDLNKGEILTGWITAKQNLTNISDLEKQTLLTLLPTICGFKLQDNEECLKLIARIVAVSPHNMFVEAAISAYDLIKSDDCSSLKGEL